MINSKIASPIQIGTEIVIDTVLKSSAYKFAAWNQEIASNRKIAEKVPEEKIVRIEKQMDIGLQLAKLNKKADNVISPFLMIDMTIFLISSIGWLYYAFTIFFHLEVLAKTYQPLFSSIIAVCLTGSSIYRIWLKCDTAQFFLNARGGALKELKKDLVEMHPDLDSRLQWKAEVVEERLSNQDAFAPGGFFTLDRSTFLPTIASAFTYFIIIIQFKLSQN